MKDVVMFVAKALCFAMAAVFVISILFAQSKCPLYPANSCNGLGDIWVIPLMLAFLGIPALTGCILIIISAMKARRNPNSKRYPT
jgi:hypothetical protein